MSTPSFPDLLVATARADGARPFLTFYDDASGERTELSVTTYLNWVMKTANLLIDEYELADSDTVLIDLPAHWLGAVFVGAAWYAGLAVTTDRSVAHDLAVVGPDDTTPSQVPRLACSLRPFAVRFPQPTPAGTDDYGLLWPGQPDAFLGTPAAGVGVTAWRDADGEVTFAEVFRSVPDPAPQARILTNAGVHSDRARLLIEVLAGHGSLVVLRNADGEPEPQRCSSERVSKIRWAQPIAENPEKPLPR